MSYFFFFASFAASSNCCSFYSCLLFSTTKSCSRAHFNTALSQNVIVALFVSPTTCRKKKRINYSIENLIHTLIFKSNI